MHQIRNNDNNSLGNHDGTKGTNKLRVIGKGTVSVRPDGAEVIVGVTTEDKLLEVAQQENAQTMQQVINSIRALGVPQRNIQTINYNIRPNYDYINGQQIFRGYEVINNLEVVISDINSVGQIIDTAVSNGANSVNGIIFIISDETAQYYEALRRAVEDAQNKARVIANELNVNLDIIPIQINEQKEEEITPTIMTLKSSNASTPIEAGENIINADIEAIFVYTKY